MARDREEWASELNRREFLRRAAGTGVVLSGAGSLLAACSSSTTATPATGTQGEPVGPGGLPLARPDRKVTLPLWEDPIESGLEPETGGTFTIFNYPAYFYKKLLKDFGKKYNVDVQYTAFDNISSGIRRLASGAVTPDVMEMTPDNLDLAVAGKLIKPLNLDYIPNLKKNVWPELVSPFYDGGSHYTVPYTCYATGIAWRTDKVTQDIAAMPQPWDIFWEAQAYKGKVALLSEPRETIAMALLRKGHLDINTEDPKLINQAVADLKQLNDICNIKVDDVQFQSIPEGTSWLHQAWSGDMIAAYIYYLPKGTPATALGYWKAEKGKVPIQNDCFSICKTTKKPVLSHLFLNFLLDNGVAYSNFVDFNGYQPPLNEIDPSTLVSKGVVPENLANSVLTNDDFGPDSLQEMTLTQRGQQLWEDGYSEFQAGT
ncbi:MAG TPA: extracellular solute-binding protein [Gaiellaceae bacterium]|jgi:spermidine/putrescine transport system substrate-binding protein|nr:extracellular solute-binding protein [Gaiellaceae bacterium]